MIFSSVTCASEDTAKNAENEAANAKAEHRDFRAGDVRHSLADISRAATRLGYAPRFDVRQGLRLAGDWYAANL